MQALAAADFMISISSFWRIILEKFNHVSDTMYLVCAYTCTFWSAIGLDTRAAIAASLFAKMLSVDRFFAIHRPLTIGRIEKARVLVTGLFALAVVV
jgi:hypothetical protein